MEEHMNLSGAYFVAAELERRGFLTRFNSKESESYDFVITSDRNPRKQYEINVKIQSGIFNIWKVNDFDRKNKSDKKFYIFCKMNFLGAPEYFVVPAKDVADKLNEDQSMNRFQFFENSPYLNAWNLLER